MTVKKDSWVYKVACLWAKPPESTNLCRFFWRVVFSCAGFPLVLAAAGAFICVLSPPLFFFARRIDFSDGPSPSIPFKRWPAIRGHRIYPVYLFVPAVVWVCLGLLVAAGRAVMDFFVFVEHLGLTAVLLTCLFIILFWTLRSKGKDSAFWSLIKEYARAKKQKVCPMIEFE